MKTKKTWQGKTYAEIAKQINQRYKNRGLDSITQTSYEREILELVTENSKAKMRKQAQESQKAAWGKLLNDPPTLEDVNPTDDTFLGTPVTLGTDLSNAFLMQTPNVPFPKDVKPTDNTFVAASTDANSANKKEENLYGLMPSEKTQLIAGTIPGVYNITRGLFSSPDKVAPAFNTGLDAAINRITKNRVSGEPMLRESAISAEAAKDYVRKNSSNASQMMANLQNVASNQGRQRSQIASQVQQLKNQQQEAIARLETARGEDRVRASENARKENLLNESAKQGLIAQGLSQLSQSAGAVGKTMAAREMDTMGMKLAEQIADNFGLDTTQAYTLMKILLGSNEAFKFKDD